MSNYYSFLYSIKLSSIILFDFISLLSLNIVSCLSRTFSNLSLVINLMIIGNILKNSTLNSLNDTQTLNSCVILLRFILNLCSCFFSFLVINFFLKAKSILSTNFFFLYQCINVGLISAL